MLTGLALDGGDPGFHSAHERRATLATRKILSCKGPTVEKVAEIFGSPLRRNKVRRNVETRGGENPRLKSTPKVKPQFRLPCLKRYTPGPNNL